MVYIHADNTIVSGNDIETVSGIKIAVSDWSPLQNEAMRVDVTKTDSSKGKYIDTYYILSGSGSVYISTDSGDTAFYKSIDIRISKMSGSVFSINDYLLGNTNVAFYYDDTTDKRQIQDGDYVDNNRNLRMIVTAQDGYQLYKKTWFTNDKTDKYEVTLKYSKIQSVFNDMVKKVDVRN